MPGSGDGCLPLPGQPGKTMLRAAFPSNDGSGRIKWVLPSRLQAVETVFAMTVLRRISAIIVYNLRIVVSGRQIACRRFHCCWSIESWVEGV